MLLATALLCQFLLSVSAIALRSKYEHLATHLGRRVEGEVVRKLSRDTKNLSYAGVETFTADQVYRIVTATFTVPTCSIPKNGSRTYQYSMDAAIGYDSIVCDRALRAGVACITTGDEISYHAWYEWNPVYPKHVILEVPVRAGDVVSLIVSVGSATNAIVSVENLTTGAHLSNSLSSPYGFCGQDYAWWCVLFDPPRHTDAALARFGEITFHNALAFTNDDTISVSTTGGNYLIELPGFTVETSDSDILINDKLS